MFDPGTLTAQIGAAFAAPGLALVVPTALSAFLLGLGGAAHCVGMCGGIITTLARRAQEPVVWHPSRSPVVLRAVAMSPAGPASPVDTTASPPRLAGATTTRPIAFQFAYNLGRIASYTAAGAIAGAVGSATWFASRILPIQQAAFAMASLMMILIGLHLAGIPVLAHWLERIGARAWRWIQPGARASLRRPGLVGALLAGAAWGWVPCGMVYGVLTAALFSGSAPAGAAIALAFGLGTLPALTALGWAAQLGLTRPSGRSLMRVAGVLIAGWGLAGLLRIDPLAHLRQFGEACASWLR